MFFKQVTAAGAVLLFTACGPEASTGPAVVELDSQTQSGPCEGCDPLGDSAESLVNGIFWPIPTYTGPYILFYEDNFCTGDSFAAAVTPDPLVAPSNPILIPDESSHRIGLAGWKNDEARSMKLIRWPAGVRVRVCDSPSCATNDDWTDYRFKVYTPEQCIHTFEPLPPYYDPEYGWVTTTQHLSPFRDTYWHYVNGLDGKVSKILIESNP